MAAGIFDIIGPVMVGPSSSHTAGAVRLGNIARQISRDNIIKADFYLHGSFARTFQGHGTDRALLGGILGFRPDDERIKDVFKYAGEQNMEYHFYTADLGEVHPNTVKIVLEDQRGKKLSITGSSTGGGNILITAIDDMPLEFTGRYPTIITRHQDKPGIVARTAATLSGYEINIAFLKVFRPSRGSEACMVIETDQDINNSLINELENQAGINRVIFIKPLS
ncbi:MAG TPA: L-serine ammonia-lyase, iron-sulfur-dependent subunit beta [Syntrophomonadaceae bacterium]|nr:L-serine ammonia-lyase, iron-sulfur-dependent subunit beta [Syntrophomonadaceae bacterium]